MKNFTRMSLVSSAILFLIILGFLVGCSILPQEEEALAPPLVMPKRTEYELYKVVKKDIVKTLKGNGTLIAANEQALYFTETGGRLKSIDVKLNQEVKKGTVLVRLDPGNVESRIKLQENEVAKKEIQLEGLKKTYGEYAALPQDSQPAKKDMEDMQNNIRLLEIDLNSAKIQLDDLRKVYAQANLVSPIDGLITFIEYLKAGDEIEAYKAIVAVSDPNDLQVYYQTVDNINDIKVGMKARVKSNTQEYQGEVILTPDNVPKDAFEKYKNSIVMKVDSLSPDIRLGDSMEFTIEIQKKPNVLVIPLKGLRSFMGENYVQIMDGESKKELNVEVGIKSALEVEILSGLKEGQMVILN